MFLESYTDRWGCIVALMLPKQALVGTLRRHTTKSVQNKLPKATLGKFSFILRHKEPSPLSLTCQAYKACNARRANAVYLPRLKLGPNMSSTPSIEPFPDPQSFGMWKSWPQKSWLFLKYLQPCTEGKEKSVLMKLDSLARDDIPVSNAIGCLEVHR